MSFLGGLLPGDMGITQTVNAMVYAVKFAVANHHELRQRAESVVASCIERSEQCEIEKIFDFVLRHFRFLSDPTFLERIKSPEIVEREISTLGQMQGDCDDVSSYIAALLMSIGYRVQFVVIAIPGQGEPYRHIFPQVYLRQTGKWLTLDACARRKPLGWEAPSTRRRAYPIN